MPKPSVTTMPPNNTHSGYGSVSSSERTMTARTPGRAHRLPGAGPPTARIKISATRSRPSWDRRYPAPADGRRRSAALAESSPSPGVASASRSLPSTPFTRAASGRPKKIGLGRMRGPSRSSPPPRCACSTFLLSAAPSRKAMLRRRAVKSEARAASVVPPSPSRRPLLTAHRHRRDEQRAEYGADADDDKGGCE